MLTSAILGNDGLKLFLTKRGLVESRIRLCNKAIDLAYQATSLQGDIRKHAQLHGETDVGNNLMEL